MRAVLFTVALLALGPAQAQMAASTPSVASKPNAAPASAPAQPEQRAAPEGASMPPAGSATTAPAGTTGRRTSAITMPVDPRGGGWEGTMPAAASLDSVVNSGAPAARGQAPRKVCPPGLFNRDGNCVAPASAIMK